uniref:hypothetical protein n=1 Tax=Parerythrobacter lutipelagi TaxID=1964208 RepID=UPI0010F879D6|nr:hypothetical protein [Parerythrobacter lutipelagi]
MNLLASNQFMAVHGTFVGLPAQQLHVSDHSISHDEFAFHQKRSAEADLKELIWLCRDRYVYVLALIKPHALPPESLFDRSALDLANFHLAWSRLCAGYREIAFDQQIDLFEAQRGREIQKWVEFVDRKCFARFKRDPEWTRCVLETANLLEDRPIERELDLAHLIDDIIEDLKERNDCGQRENG